jgi:hypothetical protein
MHQANIDRVEVFESGQLLVGIEGPGEDWYQYVYRAAASVYWNPSLRGFTIAAIKHWSCVAQYAHLVSVVRQELGVELVLSKDIKWSNVAEDEREKIANGSIA